MRQIRNSVCAVLTVLPALVFAQKTNFRDDVFPVIWGLSLDGQKSRLNEYLLEEPNHPFSLYRTAMIYEVNYRQANPLTDYEYAMANAKKAEENYTRAQSVVKADEVKSHDDFYAKIYGRYDAKGKPDIPFAIVETRIRNGLDSARWYQSVMPAIYKDFTRSVEFYEKAIRSFSSINSRYSTTEDLQMLLNAALEAELLQLRRDYDSSLYYLNSYLRRTTTYKPLTFSQKLVTRPVGTFRLDGFVTVLNFLVPTIRLWDYGAWVDETLKLNKGEVADLRNKLQTAYKSLQASLEAIDRSSPMALPKPYKVDKQIYFNLGKYDKPSLVTELLTYTSFLQDWRLQEKTLPSDTARSEMNAAVLTSLVYATHHADTLLQEIRKQITPHNLEKHKEFFTSAVGGEKGLLGYISAEDKQIRERYARFAAGLRSNLLVSRKKDEFSNPTQSVKHGHQLISLDRITPAEDQLKAGKLVAIHNFKNADGSAYLLGEHYPDKTKSVSAVFVAQVTAEGHVNWLKSFSLAVDSVVGVNNHIGPSLLLQDGVALIIRAEESPDNRRVFLLDLNSKGEERFRHVMADTDFPRQLLYEEKNNAFVVAQRGAAVVDDPLVHAPLVLTHVNTVGEQNWRQVFSWKGTFTTLFTLSNGLGVVGNYTEFTDEKGKVFKTADSGKCSPFLSKINESGAFISRRPIPTETSMFVTRVVRLGDNGINLIGFPISPAGSTAGLDPRSALHLLANQNGQIICKSF